MATDGRAAHPKVPILSGIGPLCDEFDGFIMDLWGVIHGGVEPYPGVVATLERLHEADKPVVLLSNAPRRAASAVRRLREIGIDDRLYRRLVTSGEAAHQALRDRPDPTHAALGRNYLYIGPDWDNDLVRHIDYVEVSDVAEADFLLCVGLYDEADPLARYDELFERAAKRGLPFVCVNPDLWVHRQSGVKSPCAGLLAERYQDRHAGDVIYHGKPDPAVFRLAAEALGLGEGARILVVGDSLTTDLRGATAAGFESLFVTRGIFAEALGIEPGEEPHPDELARLCAEHGERPLGAIATLRW